MKRRLIWLEVCAWLLAVAMLCTACNLFGWGKPAQEPVEIARGLVAWYPLDFTNSGGADASGHGHDLQADSGTPKAFANRHGLADKAYDFDNASSLKTGSTMAFAVGTGDFALSFWFYARGNGDEPLVNQYSNNNWLWDIRLGWSSGSSLPDVLYTYCGGPDGNPSDLVQASATVTLEQWHHVLLQRQSGVLECHLDGVKQVVVSNHGNLSADSPLYLATFDGYPGLDGDGGMFFNGALDDVRFYNRALNQAEIDWLRQE